MPGFYTKAIAVMNQVGFYPNSLLLDGRIHSFRVAPNEKKKKGWYVGFEKDDRLFLVFNDWRRMESPFRFVLFADEERDITADTFDRCRQDFERIQKQIKTQEKIRNNTAALEAEKIWSESLISTAHPYLASKGIREAYGSRVYKEFLIIPICDIRLQLWGIQKISAQGRKLFLSGMKKKGCFHLIGTIQPDRPIAICEGFATGVSFHHLSGLPVFIALDAGNLRHVAKAIRTKYTQPLIFAADNDAHGVGIGQATKAAESVKGACFILTPTLSSESGGKDFNDMHRILGEEEARRQIMHALDWFAISWRERMCPNYQP